LPNIYSIMKNVEISKQDLLRSIDQEIQLPEWIEMYEISGQDDITKHSFERYRKDKDQDDSIRAIVENSSNPSDPKGNSLLLKIKNIPKKEKIILIREALEYPNAKIQSEAIDEIKKLDGLDRKLLIKEALDHLNAEVREKAITFVIYYLQEEEKKDFICDMMLATKKSLGDSDTEIQKSGVNIINRLIDHDLISRADSIPLYEYVFENCSIEVQDLAMIRINNLPDDGNFKIEFFPLREKFFQELKKIFESNDPEAIKTFLPMLREIPNLVRFYNKKISIISKMLDYPNIDVRIEAAKTVQYTANVELMEMALDHPDAEVRRLVAQGVCLIHSNDITRMILKMLNDNDIEVRKSAANGIWAVPEEERAPLIEKIFYDQDIEVQKEAADKIDRVQKEKQIILTKKVSDIIDNALLTSDIRVQKIAIKMARLLPEKKAEQIFQTAIERGILQEIIKPRLYNNSDINRESFERRAFTKTGSGLTLIGGELKNNTIIRHIKPEAFLEWQKLFENYELWKQNGFDYVPIEPIQSYRLNENGLVDVYSGTLDLSLQEWEDLVAGGDGPKDCFISKFKNALVSEKYKIEVILNQAGVSHGHTHHFNFCLRFFRNNEGNIDFKTKPRIYLIDFDQAVSL